VAPPSCLAYVDLNPIRAGIAETPETSRFTSVYERIRAIAQAIPNSSGKTLAQESVARPGSKPSRACSQAKRVTKPSGSDWLSPFELAATTNDCQQANSTVPTERASHTGCLPMSFGEYLNLLDWTGRQIRKDKRGAIPAHLAPILERLQVTETGWLDLMGQFSRLFRRAAGTPHSLERQQRGCRLMHGIRHSRAVFV
jgi:hypothetical protein